MKLLAAFIAMGFFLPPSSHCNDWNCKKVCESNLSSNPLKASFRCGSKSVEYNLGVCHRSSEQIGYYLTLSGNGASQTMQQHVYPVYMSALRQNTERNTPSHTKRERNLFWLPDKNQRLKVRHK